jgi:hypothetical protein
LAAATLLLDMKEAIERNRRSRAPGSDVLSILIQALDRQPNDEGHRQRTRGTRAGVATL